MIRIVVSILLILLQFSGIKAQPQPETPALDVFYEMQTTRCDIQAGKEEKWQLIRLHLNHQLAGVTCGLTKQQTFSLLVDMLEANQKVNGQQPYQAMMIGHIEDYAWLQRHLTETARRDTGWSMKKAKPAHLSVNAYVSQLLSMPDVIDVFNLAGEKQGYRFSTMDCEKVFISAGGLPYDAFCWLKME